MVAAGAVVNALLGISGGICVDRLFRVGLGRGWCQLGLSLVVVSQTGVQLEG